MRASGEASAGVPEDGRDERDGRDSDDEASPWRTLRRLRERRPRVHVISNFVAADLTANLLLAAGARVAMAQDRSEVADFVAASDALCVSLGTFAKVRAEAMVAAARQAVDLAKPWVLDPVAVSASPERRELAKRLTGLQPTLIRGNAAEILSLGDGESEAAAGSGVESGIEAVEALDAAHDLAKTSGAVVAVTGPVDYVTDGERIAAVANGDPMMTRVTGVGCALSALAAAACAVEPRPLAAASHMLAILGLAGELAAAESHGPGSFRTRLVDVLYNLDEESLVTGVRIE